MTMTTTTRETQIEVDPKVPIVRTTREFDFPAEAVFGAHADPDVFTRWIGPPGSVAKFETFDFRTGGSFRLGHTVGTEVFWLRGCFHEVRDGELIVQTFTFEGEPDTVALERITFEDIGDGRSRLTTSSLSDSFEARDARVAGDLEDGGADGYARLDEVLAAG
jgi:uncharacterized protein YndB with AHSA1/START domain